MIATILFWSGTILAVLTGILSLSTKGQDKIGAIVTPITLLLAAAVARYIGY